jgi:hypothetical protein
MQRAGHESFQTTQLDVREADAIRDGFGEVFPPLTPLLHPQPGSQWSTIGPRRRHLDRLKRGVSRRYVAGWTGLEGGAARGIEGVSAGYRGVASAAEDGKAADTPPMHDTLDRSLDQSSAVEVALAKTLAEAAAAGRYDVVLQLARRLEVRPVRDASRSRADDLSVAVRLAAEAGEWAVVATLSRQLDSLRREREGGGLKVIKGGSGASGSGER